jgi:hypothetical protein
MSHYTLKIGLHQVFYYSMRNYTIEHGNCTVLGFLDDRHSGTYNSVGKIKRRIYDQCK